MCTLDMRFALGFLAWLLSWNSSSAALHHYRNIKQEVDVSPSELKLRLDELVVKLSPIRKVLQNESQDVQLINAVLMGDYFAVARLLNEGADPNYTIESGQNVLGVAITQDHGRIVTLLLSNGADTEGKSSSVDVYGHLQVAALYGSPRAAAALIERGVPLDRLNSFGKSALHAAASEGSIRVAKLLLDNGASVNIRSADGVESTPLHFAAANAYLSMVQLLLSRGADVNAQSASGITPLHEAAQENSGLIIQELVDHGASFNLQSVSGATPLFQAAAYGNLIAIENLVLNGADKSIKALDDTPRDAVCICTNAKDIQEICSVEACEHPQKMYKLLS